MIEQGTMALVARSLPQKQLGISDDHFDLKILGCQVNVD